MPRELFLHPPEKTIIDNWIEPDLPPIRYHKEYEAECSSLIEGETDYLTNLKALQIRRKDVTVDMLNYAHSVLLKGILHKQPGRLRTFNVYVGNYKPPEWRLVPSFMQELDDFLKDTNIPPGLKATWGHIMFETIHPYTDGNGRIGRILVNKILNRPWSPAVWADRPMYYSLLDVSIWQLWAGWMVKTLENCPTRKGE